MKTISYVLYREHEFIVAQCLNVEVSSFGATREEAVANLKEAVELYFDGESGNDYTPVSEIAIGQEMVDA
jgi:predicted RNase H-like HicB family nuclease